MSIDVHDAGRKQSGKDHAHDDNMAVDNNNNNNECPSSEKENLRKDYMAIDIHLMSHTPTPQPYHQQGASSRNKQEKGIIETIVIYDEDKLTPQSDVTIISADDIDNRNLISYLEADSDEDESDSTIPSPSSNDGFHSSQSN